MDQESFNRTVNFFFTIQLLIKLYHWNTTSFAQHKATDQLLDNLGDNIDKFVEVFIGKYKLKPTVENLQLDNAYLTETNILVLFNKIIDRLTKVRVQITDSGLLAIIDDMLNDINQTFYLFNLS